MHVWDDVNGYASLEIKPYAYRKKFDGKYRSIFGDSLEKVTRFHPMAEGLWESDVPYETRFLIDAYGESDDVSTGHRMAVLDIEVETKGGYPDMETANQPLTAIALYDSVSKVYYSWIVDVDHIVESSSTDGQVIVSCETEDDLISSFLTKWEEICPTIVTGWNTNEFDLIYLYNRICRVTDEATASRLSPIGIVYFNKFKQQMTIAGVNCLDYLRLYKWYSGKKLPNYRLDTVGKEELKIGKIEYEGSLDHLMRTDIKKYVEYNIHDVRLVVQLDDRMQFIALAMSICHICHVGYEEYYVSSKFLEGALLTYLRRKRLVAPNKIPIDRDAEEAAGEDDDDDEVGFEGAYVKDPIPGKYSWVCSSDINSLYPSTIMSLNISPETKVGKIPDWDAEKFVRGQLGSINLGGTAYTVEEFRAYITERNYCVSQNGVVYDQNKVGCIPDILKKWFAERVEFKGKMKDASKRGDKAETAFWKLRQQVQKILLNSLYGVLGLKNFRFFDLDNAEAVTLSGQQIIKTSEKYVNTIFNKRCETEGVDYVIYLDTDSLYLNMQALIDHDKITDPKPFAIKTLTEVTASLNSFYSVMMVRMFNSTDHRIRIAEDVVASSAFWLAKKRYAMMKVYNMELNKDVDDLEVKGLDAVRSSFPKRFGSLMEEVLRDILNGKDKAYLDAKILGFKAQMPTFPINEIAKNTSVKFVSQKTKVDFNPKSRHPFRFLHGSTAQCKASLAYNDMLTAYELVETEPILSGGKVKWTYLKENPLGLDGLAFKDDGKDPQRVMDFIATYVDRTKIWEAELQSKLVDFYQALRWPIFSVDDEKINEFFSF